MIKGKNKTMAKVAHIVGAILLILVINIVAILVYRHFMKKKVKKALQMQVNTAVSQYFKLSSQDNDTTRE